MPFKSEAQRRYLYAREPEIAKRWEKHTSKGKKLPEKVKKKKRKKTSKENFERALDEILQVLFEEESEINLGQSSKRTKIGATGVNKGGIRPKHQSDNPKQKIKHRSKKG